MEEQTHKHDTFTIDIFDVFIALAKRKWFIIIFTMIFSIGAVVYSLLTPEIWNSSAKFLTITDGMSSSSLSSSLLGSMGLDFMGGITSTEALNNILILDSRDMQKKIVREFNLIEYYEITEKDTLRALELALRKLREDTYSVFYDKETTAIIISARTKDRYMSKAIVEFVIAELQNHNQFNRTTKGKLKREFLEERVAELDKEFNALTKQLVEFKKETRLISIEDQSKQIFTLYAGLISERTKAEMEISVIKTLYGTSSPNLKELEKQVEELNTVIQNLEHKGEIGKYIVPIDKIPDAASQSLILEMRIEINRKVYEFMYPQYELARMEELKDLPTIDVIAKPDIEGLRVKPKRAVICIIVFLVAFVLSSMIAIVLEFTSQESKTKLLNARLLLFGK